MYAVQSPEQNPARRLMIAMMYHAARFAFTPQQLAEISHVGDAGLALRLLSRLQQQQFLLAKAEQNSDEFAVSDQRLQAHLGCINRSGKAILADAHGFCLVSAGFDSDKVDSLAGLCAKFNLTGTLTNDAINVLQSNRLVFREHSFFSLFVGEQRFTLLSVGPLYSENYALTHVISILVQRFGVALS